MTYDVAFRFAQALDPAALTTLTNCRHAITAAVTDCKNAGKLPDEDPAVRLLTLHMNEVASGQPQNCPDLIRELKHSCAAEIQTLKRQPLLALLVMRGVSYDEAAKRTLHSEARKSLTRLAAALELARGDYDLRHQTGGPAVSGEIILHSDQLYVCVSSGSMRGMDILFRRVTSRTDYCGARNHFAGIRELMEPERFAARITGELGIGRPLTYQPQLFG